MKNEPQRSQRFSQCSQKEFHYVGVQLIENNSLELYKKVIARREATEQSSLEDKCFRNDIIDKNIILGC